MGKAKRDSDPKNDYADGYRSGLRRAAKRLGIKLADLLRIKKK